MDDLLQQGITAYKAGKRDEARNIFITVVKQSPDSQAAWAWLYDASNNDQERIHCLKQILRINPNNEKAKQKLDSLMGQDFPFEPPQKIAPPIQAQRNTVPPVAETEKPAVSQKVPIPNQQKNTLIGIGVLLLIAVACAVGFMIFNTGRAEFKSNLNTFLLEAEKLNVMTGQGVNFQEFRTQLVEVKSSYASIDSWPSSYQDERRSFDLAIKGWELILNVWDWKINYTFTAASIDIKNYLGEEWVASDNDDRIIGLLMAKASVYFEAGKAGVK